MVKALVKLVAPLKQINVNLVPLLIRFGGIGHPLALVGSCEAMTGRSS
jgi:hypothetical protein